MFDPEYARLLAGRRPPAAAAAPDDGGDFVHLDDAWKHACRRARTQLARGKVPHEYRQIVRDFFAQR